MFTFINKYIEEHAPSQEPVGNYTVTYERAVGKFFSVKIFKDGMLEKALVCEGIAHMISQITFYSKICEVLNMTLTIEGDGLKFSNYSLFKKYAHINYNPAKAIYKHRRQTVARCMRNKRGKKIFVQTGRTW